MGERKNRGDRIRTCDHRHPIPVRYQTALRPERGYYTELRRNCQQAAKIDRMKIRERLGQCCAEKDFRAEDHTLQPSRSSAKSVISARNNQTFLLHLRYIGRRGIAELPQCIAPKHGASLWLLQFSKHLSGPGSSLRLGRIEKKRVFFDRTSIVGTRQDTIITPSQ